MKTATKNKLYEGMFLVDSALSGADWEGVVTNIKTILKKAEAEIVSLRKWDDRRLAYDINGKNRGTYILCYFKADGEKIQDIEKAVQLSEQIMRVLILSAEHLTVEDIERDTPAAKIEKEKGKRKTGKEGSQEETEEDEQEENEDLQESEPNMDEDESVEY